jgi:CheY-like chemotaxis protein
MREEINILLVDDEPDALDLFRDLFSKKGYRVECASSGVDALTCVEKADVDVVLLDIKMPEMDGLETLAKLKQKMPQLTVIMLTIYGYDEDLVNKALELGASGYISKNLPLPQIIHTFQTLLSAARRKK